MLEERRQGLFSKLQLSLIINTCRCRSCKENKSLLAEGFKNEILHLGITVGVGASDFFDIIRHQDRPGDGLILYPADLPHGEEYETFYQKKRVTS